MGYTTKLSLEAIDFTGQSAIRMRFPADRSVGELVTTAVSRLNLTHADPAGRPLVYQARHEESGEALFATEVVGDVLKSGDRVRLAPNIDAGSRPLR